MIDADEAELIAIRSQFCLLVARWRLTQAELSGLLSGGSMPATEGRILPYILDGDAERRIRLLVRLDSALRQLAPDPELATCLRDGTGRRDGLTPLESLGDLRQLRNTLARVEGARGEGLREVLAFEAEQDR